MMLVVSLALGLGLLGQVHGASVDTTSYSTADCTGDAGVTATVSTFCDYCYGYITEDGIQIYGMTTEENGMCAYTDSSCTTLDESGDMFGGVYGAVACVNGCMDLSQEYNGISVTSSQNVAITCDAAGGDDCITQVTNLAISVYAETGDAQCDVIDDLWELHLSGDCADIMGAADDPCSGLSDDDSDMDAIVQGCGYCSSAKMTTVVVGLVAFVATFFL